MEIDMKNQMFALKHGDHQNAATRITAGAARVLIRSVQPALSTACC